MTKPTKSPQGSSTTSSSSSGPPSPLSPATPPAADSSGLPLLATGSSPSTSPSTPERKTKPEERRVSPKFKKDEVGGASNECLLQREDSSEGPSGFMLPPVRGDGVGFFSAPGVVQAAAVENENAARLPVPGPLAVAVEDENAARLPVPASLATQFGQVGDGYSKEWDGEAQEALEAARPGASGAPAPAPIKLATRGDRAGSAASSVGSEFVPGGELTFGGKIKSLVRTSALAFPPALLFSTASQFCVANTLGVYVYAIGDHQVKEGYFFYGGVASLGVLAISMGYDIYCRFVANKNSKIFALNAAAMGASFGGFLIKTLMEKIKPENNELQLVLALIAASIPGALRFVFYTPRKQFHVDNHLARVSSGNLTCKQQIKNILDNRFFATLVASGVGASVGLITWRVSVAGFANQDIHPWTAARIACGVTFGSVRGGAKFFKGAYPAIDSVVENSQTSIAHTAIMLLGVMGYFYSFNDMKLPKEFNVEVYFVLAFSIFCATVLFFDSKQRLKEDAVVFSSPSATLTHTT